MRRKSTSYIYSFVIKQLVLLLNQCELALSCEHDDCVTISYLCILKIVARTSLALALKNNAINSIIGFQQPVEQSIEIEYQQFLGDNSLKYNESLQEYVGLINKEIFAWRSSSEMCSLDHSLSCSIEAAGYALFEMLVRRQYRYLEIQEKASLCLKEVHIHCEVMKQSFQKATSMGGTRTEQAKNALETALFMKRNIFNTTPRLIIVHDIDNNLTFDDSYYREFPNYDLFSKAKEVHDKYKISPWESRFSALSVFGMLNSNTRKSFLFLLKVLGRNISNLVFEDVKELLYQSAHFFHQEGGIECCIVTANNSIVASELSTQLGWFPNRVWGVNERNCDGFDKALTLLEILCANPNIILVCSDDGDSGLIQDLEKESLVQNSSINIPLSYLCFFAARYAREDEPIQYGLYEALNSRNFPFLLNWAERLPSGKMNGYQGVNKYVGVYKEWISKTLH